MANFFIRRPIVAIVIAILTVIVGAISISRPCQETQFPHRLLHLRSGCKRPTPVRTHRLLSKRLPHPLSSK